MSAVKRWPALELLWLEADRRGYILGMRADGDGPISLTLTRRKSRAPFLAKQIIEGDIDQAAKWLLRAMPLR